MSMRSFARYADWVPAAIVLGVVLVAGSRIITLSLQQHAAQAHDAAQAVVFRYGSAIDSQLQALVVRAQRESARAANTLPATSASAQRSSAVPARNTFWLMNGGETVLSVGSDAPTVHSIASEWQSADAHESVASAGLLGPIR